MLRAHGKKILYGAIALGILASGVLAGGLLHWWSTSEESAPQLNSSFVIIGAVALLLSLVFIIVAQGSLQGAAGGQASGQGATSSWEKKILVFMVLLGVIVVGSMFTWVGVGVSLKDAGPELKLPLVVIIGVVVLLVTLALVAVTFSTLNMSDRGQALALPEGSVRAVIALMLLLVFAIAAIFLYSNVANSGRTKVGEKVKTAHVLLLKTQSTVLFTVPEFVAPTTAEPRTDDVYTVYFRDNNSPAADDIAKQLIVLLGTLVTAVASFYFGSSSVASARDAADRASRSSAGPNATKASPSTLNPDGSAQTLEVTGTNLGKVVAVKLTMAGKPPIVASPATIKASDAEVTCSITIPKSTQYGTWNVVVSDASDNDSTVKNSVAIAGAKPSAANVDPDPTNLAIGRAHQPLKVVGTDLANVDTAKLVLIGQQPIMADAGSVKANDKGVICTFTIPAATTTGAWDVTVSDTGKNESTVQKKVNIG